MLRLSSCEQLRGWRSDFRKVRDSISIQSFYYSGVVVVVMAPLCDPPPPTKPHSDRCE